MKKFYVNTKLFYINFAYFLVVIFLIYEFFFGTSKSRFIVLLWPFLIMTLTFLICFTESTETIFVSPEGVTIKKLFFKNKSFSFKNYTIEFLGKKPYNKTYSYCIEFMNKDDNDKIRLLKMHTSRMKYTKLVKTIHEYQSKHYIDNKQNFIFIPNKESDIISKDVIISPFIFILSVLLLLSNKILLNNIKLNYLLIILAVELLILISSFYFIVKKYLENRINRNSVSVQNLEILYLSSVFFKVNKDFFNLDNVKCIKMSTSAKYEEKNKVKKLVIYFNNKKYYYTFYVNARKQERFNKLEQKLFNLLKDKDIYYPIYN